MNITPTGRLLATFLTITVGMIFLFEGHVCQALRIDEFEGSQEVQADVSSGRQNSVLQIEGAIGGFRTIEAQAFSGASGLRVAAVTGGGIYSHSQAASVTGVSFIIWDGDGDKNSLNPSGLGGIDLTQDGGDRIILNVALFDYPQQQGVTLSITLYDASDPTGTRWSKANVTLGNVIIDQIIEVPFQAFSQVGSAGAADLKNIGAITLLVDGANPNIDLALHEIATNGICDLLPVNGKVIDECGVCGGDNSSCADCLGVPNGATNVGSLCNTGEAGICGGGRFNQQCVCERTNNPAVEICDGIDNDCNGATDEVVDRCGVCGGDGESCIECTSEDLEDTSRGMDGGAKKQEHLILKALNKLKKVEKGAEVKAYIQEVKKTAHALQIRNWVLSWTLPSVSVVCLPADFCSVTSNLPILDEYRKHSSELLDILKGVMARIAAARGSITKADTKLNQRGLAQHQKNMSLADSVPEIQSSCG